MRQAKPGWRVRIIHYLSRVIQKWNGAVDNATLQLYPNSTGSPVYIAKIQPECCSARGGTHEGGQNILGIEYHRRLPTLTRQLGSLPPTPPARAHRIDAYEFGEKPYPTFAAQEDSCQWPGPISDRCLYSTWYEIRSYFDRSSWP